MVHFLHTKSHGMEEFMTDNYVTGSVIKRLREKKGLTQEELAEKIFVTSKAVSKWECGRGFPDISLLEGLGRALDVSVIELLSGDCVQNKNRSSNMTKSLVYVCPVCGNVILATGEAVVSCCGITLPPQEPEDSEVNLDEAESGIGNEHKINIEIVEDEYFVSLSHPMTKDHYISFIAAVGAGGVQFVKLYPEQNAEARFKIDGVKKILAYCNRHGLFEEKINKFTKSKRSLKIIL